MSHLMWGRSLALRIRLRDTDRYNRAHLKAQLQNFGSGTSLLERDWTLFQTGVACSEQWQARVAILVSPRLAICTFRFSIVHKRVVCLCLQVGELVLTVVGHFRVPRST